MYLLTVQLFIYLLFNSYNYSTASLDQDEYVPTFFGKIGNWFRNLKDRIVEFFRRPFLPAQHEDNPEVFTNSNNGSLTGPDEISPEIYAEKQLSDIFTTTESIINLTSEKPTEENTEVDKTNRSFSKSPQSAEVIEP